MTRRRKFRMPEAGRVDMDITRRWAESIFDMLGNSRWIWYAFAGGVLALAVLLLGE